MPGRASLAGVGERAPELNLPTEAGTAFSLAQVEGRPTLVSFLSHAACPFCREHVIEVTKRQEEIAGLGGAVVLVAYDLPSLLAAKMMRGLHVPYPVLFDANRDAYRGWGLDRRGLGFRLSLTAYWRYIKLLLRGEPYLGSAPDMLQLGGDFVLDRDLRIAFAHRMRHGLDRADVPVLVDALSRSGRRARS
jgi:peroxiredoxin